MATNTSSVHRTTPAEAALMATIDQIIRQIPPQGEILIDFDFLRDYTVAQLQTFFLNHGERAYTEHACLCVNASRYYYRDRHIAQLNFKKIE